MPVLAVMSQDNARQPTWFDGHAEIVAHFDDIFCRQLRRARAGARRSIDRELADHWLRREPGFESEDAW
jgi:hypothetical protein